MSNTGRLFQSIVVEAAGCGVCLDTSRLLRQEAPLIPDGFAVTSMLYTDPADFL
ncbi:MAG: hypothetical protein AB2803_06275 [Candidatus Thiodiazotropha sp.]